MPGQDLTRFAWLSIAAAVVTIALKTTAWLMTGSVGLASDAAESVVNLFAAFVALIALRTAARPPDRTHMFGHTKAEYFSAAAEGTLILIAAVVILYTSLTRFLDPQPLQNVGLGLVVSVLAAAVNGAVGLVLVRAGTRHRSITLRADGQHLLTDVWTSVGVVAGVGLVAVTGWQRGDPLIAFLVALHIMYTGWTLLRDSADGLMDASWPEPENAALARVVADSLGPEVAVHRLRTRRSGRLRFAEMHVLVPGAWTVTRGHDLVEQITQVVAEAFPDVRLSTHLEPLETELDNVTGVQIEVPPPAEPGPGP